MSGGNNKTFQRRRARVRAKISGTTERPRLAIHRSLRHLYVQVIDDVTGSTICSATTNTKAVKGEGGHFSNAAQAVKLGVELAGKAKAKGVEAVVFDRSGYRYHGVIKAFADAAREGGLKF